MPNSHSQPDHAAEIQAIHADLLAPAILTTNLTTPGTGLVLPAFSTTGYVRNGSPIRLVYVTQGAAPVTLAGGDGAYWLALMHDTSSAIAGWTRTPGTHYAWCIAGTQPADPAGGLVLAGVTVAAGSITAVDVSPNYPHGKVAYGGPAGTLAFDKEFTFNPGSKHVAARRFFVPHVAGDHAIGFYSGLAADPGADRWHVYAPGNVPSYFGGALSVQGVLSGTTLGMSGAAQVNGTLTANGALIVGGASLLQNTTTARLGIAYAAPTNVWCRSGALVADSIGVNIGDTVPTYGLLVNSTAYVSGLVGLGRATTPPWAVCVGGTSSLFADGIIYSAGTVDANLLNVRAVGSTMGTANAGYWLNVGNLYSGSTIYGGAAVDCNTLNVRSGTSYFGGGVGIGVASEAGFWLTTPNMKTGALTWNDTSNGGALTLSSNLTCANMTASGNIYGATATLTGSVNWSTPSTGTFLALTGNLNCANTIASNNLYGVTAVLSGELQAASCVLSSAQAYKVGGGPWLDSSSRRLKRNIAPIPDALGLLLEQRGRVYEWSEPRHAALLPGPRYGLVYDEVTIPQWRTTTPDGDEALAIQGAESLFIEALRQIVVRLEALEAR